MIDFIIHEPAAEYHVASQSGKYMSSHLLADFRESPELYRRKVSGQITETESPAFVLGRAAHSLILEGRTAFDREYVVSDGPINPRTGESYGRNTKAFTEWAATQDREVISGKDFGFLSKLQLGVFTNAHAMELLSEGVAEGVVRAEYNSVPCQIRMDWFNPKFGIVDLKTCDTLRWFESDCRRYGYIYQLAFYRAVLRQVTGKNFPIYIIAVEKSEPFSSGVWKLTDEVLELAELTNKAALDRFRACCIAGTWPTGYEDIRIINSI